MTRNRFVRVGILVAVTAVISVAAFVPLGSGSSSAKNGTLAPAVRAQVAAGAFRNRVQRHALAPHHCITRVHTDDIPADTGV